MSKLIVSYVKVAACAVAAFVVCACARMGGSGAAALSQPRLGDPPISRDNLGARSQSETEADRMDALERAMADLDANIVNLKRALEIMAPLPDSDEYFAATGQLPKVAAAEPATGAGTLYAIAPDLGRANSLLTGGALIGHPARITAESGWRQTSAAPTPRLVEASYTGADSVLRLTDGPSPGDAAVDALCVELSALSGPCGSTAPIRAFR